MLDQIPGLKIVGVTPKKGVFEVLINYKCLGWIKTYRWVFTKNGFSSQLVHQKHITRS